MGEKETDGLLVPRGPTKAPVHVAKRAQRNKALSVVFDPQDHKEYLNGFHKRKQQRRKDAVARVEKELKQQRLEERADRREALKERYSTLGPDLDPAAPSLAEDVERRVHVFSHGAVESRVTVSAIDLNSSDEEEAGPGPNDDDDDRDLGEWPGPGVARAKKSAVQSGGGNGGGGEPARVRTHVSKATLRAIARTKLKLEGKRSAGGFKQPGPKTGGKGGRKAEAKEAGGKKGGKGGKPAPLKSRGKR